MKTLSEKKQFQEAIDFFNKHDDRKDGRNISDAAINQALKSVTNIKDLTRGFDIDRRYSSRIEKEAFTIYKENNGIEINSVIYLLLINACSQIGILSVSEPIYDEIPVEHLNNDLFIRNALIDMWNRIVSATVLLSNIYASIGDVEKSADIKTNLSLAGLNKKSGVAWTQTNGQIHTFRAHDRSHPRLSEIPEEIEKISKESVDINLMHVCCKSKY
ncbi:unnamed protein product [Adineta ricciae]|uniref:Uncharacterized protein n=1 Tax=Adineta ricciae TaxID=249248 RepID=A0A814RB01_ADIRI|nr:unnamed protein product [Adineta ricciae]CAF1130736.1 unnamed protein product [Adineta ricciae]